MTDMETQAVELTEEPVRGIIREELKRMKEEAREWFDGILP